MKAKNCLFFAILFSFTSFFFIENGSAELNLIDAEYNVFLPHTLQNYFFPSLCYQKPYETGLLPTGEFTQYHYEFVTSGNWIPIPQVCYPQQEIIKIQISQEPNSYFIDPTYGNRILYYENLMGQTITATYKIKSALPVNYKIDYKSLGEYETSSLLYQLYTRSETWIESDDPITIQAAESIVGGEENPYLAAEAIYNWIRANIENKGITWTGDPTEYRDAYGALATYQRGYGSCQNQALVFVAMCRALGIPARVVHGINSIKLNEERNLEDWSHSWAEFFLPEYGWITADPTGNVFAEIDNLRIILSYANNLIVTPPCDDSTWYCDPTGVILSLSYPLPYHNLSFIVSKIE